MLSLILGALPLFTRETFRYRWRNGKENRDATKQWCPLISCAARQITQLIDDFFMRYGALLVTSTPPASTGLSCATTLPWKMIQALNQT